MPLRPPQKFEARIMVIFSKRFESAIEKLRNFANYRSLRFFIFAFKTGWNLATSGFYFPLPLANISESLVKNSIRPRPAALSTVIPFGR